MPDRDRSSDRGGRDSDSGSRSGDVYSSDFADRGDYERQDGGVSFSRDGSSTHNTAAASNPSEDDKGGRFSWDTDRYGRVSDPHFTDQNAGRHDRDRHPFGDR